MFLKCIQCNEVVSPSVTKQKSSRHNFYVIAKVRVDFALILFSWCSCFTHGLLISDQPSKVLALAGLFSEVQVI